MADILKFQKFESLQLVPEHVSTPKKEISARSAKERTHPGSSRLLNIYEDVRALSEFSSFVNFHPAVLSLFSLSLEHREILMY